MNRDYILGTPVGAAKKVSATVTGYTGIFLTLQQEHAMVNTLMLQLASTSADDDGQSERRRELFSAIRTELLAHASAEEMTFYRRLKSRPATSPLVDESIDEHQLMDDLLEELDRLGSESLIFDSRFRDLMATVRHHVEEEENRLFPRANEALTSAENEQLDAAFKTQKQAQLQAFRSRATAAHH